MSLALARFWRKAPAVTSLGAFDRDAALESLVPRVVDDAHAAPCHFPSDPKPLDQEIACLDRLFVHSPGNQRLQQKALHALLAHDVAPGFAKHLGPARTRAAQISFAFSRRARQRQLHQAHDEVVMLRIV